MARGRLLAVDADLVADAARVAAQTGSDPAAVFSRWVRIGMEYERSSATEQQNREILAAPGDDEG